MQKNDIITLEIIDIATDGSGVGKYCGMAVFVPFSAVGDVCLCRVLKVAKSYAYAKIEQILSPSNDRCDADCGVYKKCGGCSLRHINYSAELRAKESFVRNAFLRIGGLALEIEPILSTNDTARYRNKAQLPVAQIGGEAVCGFYSPRSHRVIPCADCRLEPEIFAEICRVILDFQRDNGLSCYDEESGAGLLRHIYLRQGYHSGEIMVCLVVTKRTKAYRTLALGLTEKFPQIKTVMLNINPEKTNVILGDDEVLLVGDGKIHDTLCGVKVEISAKSFYQVNTSAAEIVYRKAAEYAELSGSETLLDLYCGAGTVGLSMAKNVKKLIGVETVPEAIENARKNAAENGAANAEFIVGDSGKIAKMLAKRGERPDVIVVDPPRKGCDKTALDAILDMSPERVVMISCSPATAARDAKYLCERGYRAVKACPADLFPRTSHVECVVLMTRVQI